MYYFTAANSAGQSNRGLSGGGKRVTNQEVGESVRQEGIRRQAKQIISKADRETNQEAVTLLIMTAEQG